MDILRLEMVVRMGRREKKAIRQLKYMKSAPYGMSLKWMWRGVLGGSWHHFYHSPMRTRLLAAYRMLERIDRKNNETE